MMRLMCKSKIHRVRVKRADLHYEGSIGIDKNLLKAANIIPYEMVHVLNVNNGARFETYAIEEKAGSGMIALYGAAAHLGEVGDILIILSYALLQDEAAKTLKPKLVFVDGNNEIITLR
jgi:aspartate 1-decarboxylase